MREWQQENSKYLGINTLLNNTWSIGSFQENLKKYSEVNESANTTYQTVGCSKSSA